MAFNRITTARLHSSVGAGVVQRGGVATITITSTSNILGVLVSAKIAGSFAGSFVTTTTIKQQDVCTDAAQIAATVTHKSVLNVNTVDLQYNVPSTATGTVVVNAVVLVGVQGGGANQTFYAITQTYSIAEPAAANANFFLTSIGKPSGANLGGLAGADAHCAALAKNASVGASNLQDRKSVV